MRILFFFSALFCPILGQAQNSLGGSTQLNKTFYVDGTTYTLVTAYAACISQGSGKIVVAPGYTETLAFQITRWNGNCSIELPEAGTITVPAGKEFSCSGTTCDGISITGRDGVPYGTPGIGSRPGFTFVCSPGASTACFTVSGPSAAVGGVKLTGFAIDTTAGNSAAIGLSFVQLYHYEVALRFIGPGAGTSQIAWELDGSGSFTGDARPSFISANGYFNCLQLNNNSNFNHIEGLCANVATGGNHVKISGSNGNFLYINAESATIAVNITDNNQNFGNWIFLYGQRNTSDVTFGAQACGNFVANLGATSSAQIQVTDPGNCNDILNPFTHRFDANGNLFANGIGTFGVTSGSFGAGTLPVISVGATNSGFDAEAASASQDNKWWEFLANLGGSFTLRTLNDAKSAASAVWTAHRNGNSASDFTVNTLLQAGRVASSGIAPSSCAVTGAGASQTCTVNATNNTDSYIELTIGAAGAGPAASGTLTINFSTALGGNRAICQVLPMSNNNAWNARASFQQTSTGASSWVGNWDNNSAALVAGNNYNVSAWCWGR